MNASQIDFSPRKQQLKEEYGHLQQVFSELIAKRDDLLHYEGPRLEALYMDTIGQLQYEEFCLQYDIALLKYERDLLQSYLNRGEKPDMEDVKEKVGEAAGAFNENINQEEEKIKQAKDYTEKHAEEDNKQREAEIIELKTIYKNMVRRLHPDLHPDQTEWEKQLFLKVQDAYREEDLEAIRKLEEELNAGIPSDEMEVNTIEEWEQRVQKLYDQIATVTEEISRIENDFPFSYKELLNDQEWVANKQEEIRVRIEILQMEKERLEKIVAILRKGNNGESNS